MNQRFDCDSMLPSLDIVIVNWNSGDQLLRCLESLEGADTGGFKLSRVVVVDNASVDGSTDNVRSETIPVDLLINDRNRGFAAACNQGAAVGNADYILFLNPDTRVLANSLAVPVHFMGEPSSADIGICGIQLKDDSGQLTRNCVRFPTPGRVFAMIVGLQKLFPRIFPQLLMIEWDHGTNRDVDQVMGAFYLVRRDLFRQLSGFDERFFVYYEEVDFAYRARHFGWRTHYLAEAQAFHRGQGTTRSVSAIAFFYLLRSRVLYLAKHFGWHRAGFILLAMMLVEPITRSVSALLKLSSSELKTVLGGFSRFWLALPAILQSSCKTSYLPGVEPARKT